MSIGRESDKEHDVLSFVYAVIAAETGTDVADISPWAVRYRLQNMRDLHATLSGLLSDAAVESGHGEGRPRGELRDGERAAGRGPSSGQPVVTEASGAGSGGRACAPDVPLGEKLREKWAALQLPLAIPMEDLLPAGETGGCRVGDLDGVRAMPGGTVFEFAVTRLARLLDRAHLAAVTAPPWRRPCW